MDNKVLKLQKKWVDFMDTTSSQNTVIVINYDEPTTPRPWPYRENFKKRVQWHADYYLRQMERMSWLADDSIPHIYVHTGTEIFAEALGSKVHFSDENMPFALPMINSPSEVSSIKVPSVAQSTLVDQFEFMYQVRQKIGSENIYSLPDIQSPIDIAALVFEKSEFLMAMLDEPEAIKEITLKTEQLLTEFLDLWFKEFGTKYIAHYPNYYMEGGFTFSEDEVGEFSAAMFDEFCLDSLNRLSERYGGCGMHCCANSAHQWENFKKIKGLRFLNLNQPPEIINKSVEKLGTNHAHWMMYGPGDKPAMEYPPQWVKQAPKQAHVVLEDTATSREEALEQLKKLREVENERR